MLSIAIPFYLGGVAVYNLPAERTRTGRANDQSLLSTGGKGVKLQMAKQKDGSEEPRWERWLRITALVLPIVKAVLDIFHKGR